MGEGVLMKKNGIKDGIIIFNKKNKISAVNVSFWTILWNYICWVLAGKPDSHIV